MNVKRKKNQEVKGKRRKRGEETRCKREERTEFRVRGREGHWNCLWGCSEWGERGKRGGGERKRGKTYIVQPGHVVSWGMGRNGA